MNLSEMLLGSGGAIVLILSLVQIAPVKVNPWSAIARGIGRAINKEMLAEISEIKQDIKETKDSVSKLDEKGDERNATLMRTHILHFNDEILHHIEHTKEHFDQILRDITDYNDYCDTHPKYENDQAVKAIGNIRRVYDECMHEDKFL